MNTKGRHRVPKLPKGARPIGPLLPPAKPLPKNVIEVDFKRSRVTHEPLQPDPLLGVAMLGMVIFVDFSNRKKIGHVS